MPNLDLQFSADDYAPDPDLGGLTVSFDTLFLEFKLFNPIVASWSISGDEDERPTEEVTLWYWKIWMQYYTFDGKTHKSAGSKGWDRTQNKPWAG